MRGLSIQQPWADLIIKGRKRIELRIMYRPNMVYEQYRGSIAIHASQKLDYNASHFFGYHNLSPLQRGKLLAVAELVDVIRIDGNNWEQYLHLHLQYIPIYEQYWGLVLEDIRLLPKPITFRGRPGLFELTDEKLLNRLTAI